MKKTLFMVCLITATIVTQETKAQGFFGRLAKKIEEAKSGKSSSSNESSKSKSDLTILGTYHSLSIGGKQRGYEVMPIFSVAFSDVSNTNSDGTPNIMLMTYYTENGRTGQGEIFRKEITKDQIYFDNNGNNKFLMKIDDKTIVVVKLDQKSYQKLTINDALSIEIWSKDKAVLEAIKAKGTPYRYTDDATLTSYVQKALNINRTKESSNDIASLAAHEQANKYAELPAVSAFQPASAKKALPEFVKKAMAKWKSADEMLYYYIGIQKGVSVEDNWRIIKEPRRNNLGLDRIITKRSVSVVVVSKMSSGAHVYNIFQMYEDVVPGVMDGSKFTGQYYTDGVYGPAGIAAANAMVHKGK